MHEKKIGPVIPCYNTISLNIFFFYLNFSRDDVTDYFQNLAKQGENPCFSKMEKKKGIAKVIFGLFAYFTSSYTMLNRNHKTSKVKVIRKYKM